jgi:hypothetical protein
MGRDDLPGLGLLFSLPGLGIALGGQCAVALDLLGAGAFSLALDLAEVDSALPWRALACALAAALACDFLARPALSNCSCSALGFAMVDAYRV